MLSLLDTIEEIRVELASMFSIKCRSCIITTRVATDKKHEIPKQSKQIVYYDVNTRGAMGNLICLVNNQTNIIYMFFLCTSGTLNAGIRNTHFNKLLAFLNIPLHYPNTYKT